MGREGRRLNHKGNSGSSRNKGEVPGGKGDTDEERRKAPKPPTLLAFSEKSLLT